MLQIVLKDHDRVLGDTEIGRWACHCAECPPGRHWVDTVTRSWHSMYAVKVFHKQQGQHSCSMAEANIHAWTGMHSPCTHHPT